jgi:hypothetical protein
MGAAEGYRWHPARWRRPHRECPVAGRNRHDGCVPPTRADDAAPSELVLADSPGTEPALTSGSRRSRWRRLDRKLLTASLAIAFGLVLIVYALARSVTGDDAANLPGAVEEVTPAVASVQVPQQSTVIVDLQTGYEGYLEIDGLQLPTIRLDEVGRIDAEPGEQIVYPPGVRFEPGNATLSFTPGADQEIESFAPGLHTLRVVFWKTTEGEEQARSFTWTFTVV